MMFRILCTNDDGIHRAGLHALAGAMASLGEVWVVAPDRERSGISQAITLDLPLRYRPYQGEERWYQVSGTPTDCTYLAIHHLMADHPPDLVVSGINHGSNLGNDAHYSGTVAGAREGLANGIPAIAFSLVGFGDFDFTLAAHFAQGLAQQVLADGLPPGVMLNVNVPQESEGAYAVCTQGHRAYEGVRISDRRDPRGRPYVWIGGTEVVHRGGDHTDTAAHDAGLISVVPMTYDLTAQGALEEIRGRQITGFERQEALAQHGGGARSVGFLRGAEQSDE